MIMGMRLDLPQNDLSPNPALPIHTNFTLTHSFNDHDEGDYDVDEPDYDPEEPQEPDVGEDYGESSAQQQIPTDENGRGIVEAGDISAAQARGQSGIAPRDKKVPNDQRMTTPYMTKYERARVLGTRALQIRYEHA